MDWGFFLVFYRCFFGERDYILARASLTAALKARMPAGILRARMTAVGAVPQSGSPDESSNIEPTAAIAVRQAIPRNAPLFGVTKIFSRLCIVSESLELFSFFNVFSRKAVLLQLLIERDRILYPVYKHDASKVIHLMLDNASD